jgi:hypothetical protein
MNSTPMLKAYVSRSWYPTEPEAEKHTVQVQFNFLPENAAYYETREEARITALQLTRRIIAGSRPWSRSLPEP